jgi:hypothetical protein
MIYMAEHITYIGWGYAKRIIREYGTYQKEPTKCRLKPRELQAVTDAIEQTEQLKNGTERLKLIDLVFFKQTHSLQGASMKCYVSDITGRRWHTDFIRCVCENLDLS